MSERSRQVNGRCRADGFRRAGGQAGQRVCAPGGRHPGRVLVLVDIENMCGAGWFTAGQVAILRMQVEVLVGGQVQAIFATRCAAAVAEGGLGWPGSRLVRCPGMDWEDLVLIDVATSRLFAERYRRVISASRNHAFVALARHLRNSGVHVLALTGAGRMSAELPKAVDDVCVLRPSRGLVAA